MIDNVRLMSVLFSDPLTGPSSPSLTIPFPKYTYFPPLGLKRTGNSTAGLVLDAPSNTDRPMVTTLSGGYLQLNQFTATLTINLTSPDIAYFGFGQGTPDPTFFQEPTNAFLFRIHNSWTRVSEIQVWPTKHVAAFDDSGHFFGFADGGILANYGGGPLTFMIQRNGDSLTMSIPSMHVSHTFSIPRYASQMGLNNTNTYLFFGNTNVGTVFSNFSIQSDTTPPVVTFTISPPPNSSGWNKTDVTVSWLFSDPESGISSSTGCGTQTLTAETAGTTLTCTATNGAGLSSSQSVVIKIDKTPPTITGSRTPGPNPNGWNNTNVKVSFSCSDTGAAPSGVASCSSSPVTLTGEGAGQSVSGTVTDAAGNSAFTSVGGINIDKTPPIITPIHTPAANAAGWNNTDFTKSFTCVDTLSGVLPGSCPAPKLFSTEGVQTVSVGAMDLAGNVGGHTQLVKLDKTAPEAFNKFDPVTKTVQVFGRDAGSGVPSGAVAGMCVPVKWGHGDDDGDDDDDKENNAQRCTYNITDAAGNSITLVEDIKSHGDDGDDDHHGDHGKEIKIVVVSFQYNTGGVAGPLITPPRNSKKFEWSLNKDGSLKELEQKMTVGQGKDKQEVQAKFESKKNQTEIKDKRGPKEIKITKPGLVLLMLATDKGVLVIQF